MAGSVKIDRSQFSSRRFLEIAKGLEHANWASPGVTRWREAGFDQLRFSSGIFYEHAAQLCAAKDLLSLQSTEGMARLAA